MLDMDTAAHSRERLLRTVAMSVFLLFVQTYMVAPLIPSLAVALNTGRQTVGLLIPAYTIPYAIAGLICGALADRFGRRGLLFFSLAAFPVVSLAMAAAPTLNWLIALRILSGITNVGIVVTGLSLVGDLFPPTDRGRAIGWIFGAIAGGGAFGSTLGGVLAPTIGWRGLFVLLAAIGFLLLIFGLPLWKKLGEIAQPTIHTTITQFATGYFALLRLSRGARTYTFIFLNAVFHAGVFTWLGALLHDRFALGDAGIGLALLGYGVPGLFLGPTIGKVVDRHGRRYLIPAGLLTASLSAALLIPIWPLPLAMLAITILSLGFDMTHPLLAGIATVLDDRRRGQAMGLNTFSIFLGFGVGSLLFGRLAQISMTHALAIFASFQALFGVLAIYLFQEE
jgi:predicted MFS family arabinose efflux permease